MSASATTPQLSKVAQFMGILDSESPFISKKGKTRKFLNKIKYHNYDSHHDDNDDEITAIIRRFIHNKFKKSIYDDELRPPSGPNTGRYLITKLYFMVWTPERREQAKTKRKVTFDLTKKEKDNNLAKAQAVAASKRADKEKMEMLRLGKGNMALGVKLYEQRMQKDKERKAKKDALEMSQDAEKTLEFWKWRLETNEGKCYNIPVHGAQLVSVPRHGFIHKTKMISVKPTCAKEALQYILETGYATRFNITFTSDSQGKVHLYSIVHKANNPSHHITMAPLTAMHFVGVRKTPTEISGSITNYRINDGTFYIQTNETTISNAHFLLPDKWIKFQKAYKYIGEKRYVAQPTTGTTVPLLLDIRDPKAIKSFSWVDNHVQYKAVLQEYGKDLDYIKSLREKSQIEKEAEALEKMAEKAKQQKTRRRIAAIAREFAKRGEGASLNEIQRTFATVEARQHTKPNFCPHCRSKVTVAGASWCSSCGKPVH